MNEYKATLRIPTGVDYAYIEVSYEGSPDAIKEAYDQFTELFKVKTGLPKSDFDAFVDRQLLGDSNHVEEYNRMSPIQNEIVQTIKRSLKRIEARQNKQ